MFSVIVHRGRLDQPSLSSSFGLLRSPPAVIQQPPVIEPAQRGVPALAHPELSVERVQSGSALPETPQPSLCWQQQVQVRV